MKNEIGRMKFRGKLPNLPLLRQQVCQERGKNGGYTEGKHADAGMSRLFSETAGISEIV